MDLLTRVRTLLAGQYDVERVIGQGGMSVVYLAHDRKHDRSVAVKVLRPELTESIGAERFAREIRVTSHLEHIHVLPLFDSGSVDGLAYYVMPYVEGGSLRDRLRREGALGLDEIVRITGEIADGLAHAHAHGIVHRDIKPENVLFLGEHAVVADFGIAHAFRRVGDADTGTLTEYGVAIGTPAYMSPEQASGELTIDHRSDLYALGCVVYEMLSGGPPFEGATTQAVLAKHMSERVPSLAIVRADIPHGIVRAVEKALAKVAGDRFTTATSFAKALREGRRSATEPAPSLPAAVGAAVRRRPALAAVVAAAALSAYPAVQWIRGPPEVAWEGRPESVVVLPFHTSTSDDGERELAVDLAGLLTRELSNWETIDVIPSVALSGPMFDLGLPDATLGLVGDGVRLARSLGVQAMVAVTASRERDSVRAEATLHDAATGRTVGRTLRAYGTAAEPMQIVERIAREILGLGEIRLDPARLRRGSANPDALVADFEGTESLARWRLADAERSFRRAIDHDSTFALALHHLAQTRYWEGRESEAPEWSTRAVSHATGLPQSDSLHIVAFHAFLVDGDYPRARAMYHRLLEADSTDVYAWLMLGAVEYQDPWAMQLPDGTFLPRSNLNVALRAFANAVQLQPRFDLGYGHRGDIIWRVVRTARDQGCWGFERPRRETRLPWEVETPEQMLPFCPVAGDTIVWERDGVHDGVAAIEGADRLMQEWGRILRRWAEYAPGEPRPRDELARLSLEQRRWVGVARPETIDSLTTRALRAASEALALKADTAPEDLLRLGNLHLGLGQVDTALALTEAALSAAGGADVPSEAANVFLATGQPSRALPIVSMRDNTTFLKDSVTGELVSYGGGDAVVDRIRVLAATGVTGEPLRREFGQLDRIWAGPSFPARTRSLLRRNAQSNVRVAMLFDPSVVLEWAEGLDPTDPLWQAFAESDSRGGVASEVLDRAMGAPSNGVPAGDRKMLLGVLAARAGRYALAASLYAAIDSVALSVEGFDPRWGLRSLSYLLRAEAFAAMGERDLAREYAARFRAAWQYADSLTAHLGDRLPEP